MSEYKIFTDSASDLSYEIIKKFDINIVSLHYSINSEVFEDIIDEKRNENLDNFYQNMKNENIYKTSQANPAEFIDYFTPTLSEGKDILYISFSSGLSGTYNSSLVAKNDLLKRFPDRKIKIVDSKCASLGEGLLVYEASLKKEEGLSIDALKNWIEKIKGKIAHPSLFDDLGHLKNGGRISSSVAFFGGLLNIKPIISVNNLNGKLEIISKKRGRKNSIDFIIEYIKDHIINDPKRIFIGYTLCKDDSVNLLEELNDTFGCEIFINEIGPCIGAHAGINVLSAFFLSK